MDLIKSKQNLLERLTSKGLLWSYDVHTANDIPDDVLLEHVMKYGDVDEIYSALEIFGKEKMQQIWENTIKYDYRFIKLSVFLARMIFKLNIEAEDIKKGIDGKKLFRRFNTTNFPDLR